MACRRMHWALALSLGVGLAAQGGWAASLPSWVEEPPRQAGMAYGVGSASIYADAARALNRAQDAARLELVKKLRVQVSGQTTVKKRQQTVQGETQLRSSIARTVRNQVPQVKLDQIDIVETHVAKESETAFALARLDRRAAAQSLSERIAALNADLRPYRDKGKTGSRLAQVQALAPALATLTERRRVIDKLKLVAPDDWEKSVKPDRFTALKARIYAKMAKLRLALQPDSENAQAIAPALRRALTERGLTVQRNGKHDLALSYRINLEIVEKDAFFALGRGSVSIVGPKDRVLGEFQADVKGVSARKDSARGRAIEKLGDQLADHVAQSLLTQL